MAGSASRAKDGYARLSFFFWLPAGKDEFGFNEFREAPYHATAFYRTDLEQTISDHFDERAELLREGDKLAFMVPTGRMVPMDGELGLRKIHFQFSYRPNFAALDRLLGGEPLDGTAIVMSNGLYLWSFEVPNKAKLTSAELRPILVDFLAQDFIERHIRHLFDFSWKIRPEQSAQGSGQGSGQASGQNGGARPYAGVMTYFQLDTLFNGVFDEAAHPHLLQRDQWSGPSGDKETDRRARRTYDIEHLIKAVSLCGFDNEYFPLFDVRKDYSLRRHYGDEMAWVDSGADLRPESVDITDEDGLHRRELLLSKLSFAGLEQFLRVSASFGLTLYRIGLDHVRAELASQSIEARQNRPSGELRRPSLADTALTLGDLEAYYVLLAGKLPRLRFLGDLADGLAEASRPTRDPKENGVPGAVEWHYSRSTLLEARTQFARQIDAIAADLSTIESSLVAVRADLTLSELTEARKLTEIEAETPRSAVLEGPQWSRLNARLAIFAALIGGAQIFTGVAVWITDKAVEPDRTSWWMVTAVATWVIGLLVFFLLYLRYRKIRPRTIKKEEPDADLDSGDSRAESHVYDYSSFLKPIDSATGSKPIVDKIRRAMTDIEGLSTSKCVNFSTFKEMPASGVERIKYSLEAPPSEHGLVYFLHIEVDRRAGATDKERLVGVRLVVRSPRGATPEKLDERAENVMASCIKQLLFPKTSDHEDHKFFYERFGWDWPPGAGTSP